MRGNALREDGEEKCTDEDGREHAPGTLPTQEILEKDRMIAGLFREIGGDQDAPSTDPPQDNSGASALGPLSDSPRLIPAPDSPTLSVQLASSSSSSGSALTPCPVLC